MFTAAVMGIFLTAVFFLLITPGPGVLSTAGVGAAYGAQAGYRYVLGLCIGTNIVALAVVTGLAGVVLAQPALRTILLYALMRTEDIFPSWLLEGERNSPPTPP